MTMNKLEGTHLYAMKPLKDGFMIDRTLINKYLFSLDNKGL